MTLAEVFIFPKAKEKAFQNFFYKQDLIVCRTATVLVITIMLVLGFIDYYRIYDMSWVILARIIVCLVLLVLLAITFQKKITANLLQVYLIVINITMVGSFFFMDAMTKMPGFYLPNSLVIYFFVSSTVSGTRFRYSSILNFFVLVTFILYFPSSYNWAFHKSQLPNIIIGFTVSLLISFMWEWYKRTNFLQQTQLNNLINIFSHDMASPLNSLVGLMSLKDENLVNKEEFALHQENIKKSIQNNILLLQNLVKWSKSQMDGFKPKLEPIDLQAIVKDAITLLHNTAGEKNIKLANRVQPVSVCLADQEMIKLVLRNTVSNAIKFSHPNSTIEVESIREDKSITLAIKDKGIGMTKEEMEKLFTMTVESQPGTENERGAGIGLFITNEFVKLNKGKISVESKKGSGSTIKISLPEFS